VADTTGSSPPDADRLLRIYLQDHHAGSVAGLALAQRCRRETPRLAAPLGDIEREIAEDQQALEAVMSDLGILPSRAKMLLGSAAEAVARLKANGRIVRRSPSSTVVELEALMAGVATKRNLWRALVAVTDHRAGLDRDELERLADRATGQLECLAQLHEEAAGAAFGVAASTPAPGAG
jgi:hypothetical protein